MADSAARFALFTVVACATGDSSSGALFGSELMLHGAEGLQLGMTAEALHEVRPNVYYNSGDLLEAVDGGSNQYLFTHAGSDRIARVPSGADRLAAVIMERSYESESTSAVTRRFAEIRDIWSSQLDNPVDSGESIAGAGTGMEMFVRNYHWSTDLLSVRLQLFVPTGATERHAPWIRAVVADGRMSEWISDAIP